MSQKLKRYSYTVAIVRSIFYLEEKSMYINLVENKKTKTKTKLNFGRAFDERMKTYGDTPRPCVYFSLDCNLFINIFIYLETPESLEYQYTKEI